MSDISCKELVEILNNTIKNEYVHKYGYEYRRETSYPELYFKSHNTECKELGELIKTNRNRPIIICGKTVNANFMMGNRMYLVNMEN